MLQKQKSSHGACVGQPKQAGANASKSSVSETALAPDKAGLSNDGLLVFAPESVTGVMDDAVGLLEEHCAETASFIHHKMGLDLSKYVQFQRSGVLHCFSIRQTEDGQLVGYALFYLAYFPQASHELQAVQETIYLTPRHRPGGKAIEFMQYCDEQLRQMGAASVQHMMPLRRAFDRILPKLGYTDTQKVWIRRFDDE